MTLRVKVASLSLLLVAGCSRPERDAGTASASEPALSRQYRNGPLTVILSASETNITTAGRVRLTLDVQTPENYGVVLPDLGILVEPFTLAGSYEEPPQTLRNKKVLHRWVFLLDPALPGDFVFQALEIAAGPALVTTEPISVSVSSILPSDIEELQIRDISSPVALLPEQRRQLRYWMTGGGIVLLLVAAGLLVWLRKRALIEVPVPPHETAFQALEKLPDEPIARIHELNRILREYIENRFNLPMLGKTTHEILPMLGTPQIMELPAQLIEFLEAGEQIRFAHAVPDGFIDSATDWIRSFIEQTRETGEEEPCD